MIENCHYSCDEHKPEAYLGYSVWGGGCSSTDILQNMFNHINSVDNLLTTYNRFCNNITLLPDIFYQQVLQSGGDVPPPPPSL